VDAAALGPCQPLQRHATDHPDTSTPATPASPIVGALFQLFSDCLAQRELQPDNSVNLIADFAPRGD